MSAAVECVLLSPVCSSVCVCVSEEARGSHAEHTARSYYAHPRRRDGKQEGTHTPRLITHNPADSLVPFQPPPPPHPTTSATTHRTASPPGVDRVWNLSSSTSNCVWLEKRCHKSSQQLLKRDTKTCKHYWCCPINVNSWISDFRSLHVFAPSTAQQRKSTFQAFSSL